MSPKLRPLILPQVVEARNKIAQLQQEQEQEQEQEQQQEQEHGQEQQLQLQLQSPPPDPAGLVVVDSCQTIDNTPAAVTASLPSLPPPPATAATAPTAIASLSTTTLAYSAYSNTNSSSSDLASPLTPTFSQRGGHARFSSSSSSLEIIPPSTACLESSPVSPSQLVHGTTTSTKSGKRSLPDVQEDPLEREDEDHTVLADQFGLYDCLCDEPCIHQESHMIQSATWRPIDYGIDYDIGFLSDGDIDAASPTSRKRRTGADSPLSGFATRLSSKLPSLYRRRSSKRSNHTFTPASEPSLEHTSSLSRAPSSRSSSLSAPSRRAPDRSNEPPMPPTPALSFYDSTESVALPAVLDIEKANVRQSLERERAMATTPLLPPLMTQIPSSQNQSQPPSPLQSPTVAPLSSSELNSPIVYATPPLSTKPSFSSFRPPLISSVSAPVVATVDAAAALPNLLEPSDAWSDRLGHANYTILPKPYVPEIADLEALRLFRADWDLARVNYTKHIVRTGEHYGTTSKTYALTEAKWAETEREWKTAHDAILDYVTASGTGDVAELLGMRQQEAAPAVVPRGVLDAEGKFPDLGDVDIIGPMMRDAVMVRENGIEERQNGASKLWKSLVGKVSLRK